MERARSIEETLLALFDDTAEDYALADWRDRNIRLVELLQEMSLLDGQLVPLEAHRFLTDALIHVRNGAATDPQNAGHVRAQNENILHYARAVGLGPASLSVVLEAGFIHDLNKAIGEPLRQDEFAVRDHRGRRLGQMTRIAQIVGLNHLGERTRSAIFAAIELDRGGLAPEVAGAIDRCIVHHGLGSSRFIQDLVDGRNPWWGEEFVDPATGVRRLVHPPQPPLTLESVIHDLADSTQQMQAGTAWMMKYPSGYWRGSGRSVAAMISGSDQDSDAEIPMSLRLQIAIERRTCEEIIAAAAAQGVATPAMVEGLTAALADATRPSERWVDDRPEHLADPAGESVYHDLGRALSCSPEAAHARCSKTIAGASDGALVEEAVWTSARALDAARARALAIEIARP